MNFNPLLAVPGVLIYLIIIGARLRPYQPRVNKGLCNTPVHIAAASMLTVQTAAPKVLHQADLQNLMRLQVSDVVGCTRLLTVQGHIGCAGVLALQSPQCILIRLQTLLTALLCQCKQPAALLTK